MSSRKQREKRALREEHALPNDHGKYTTILQGMQEKTQCYKVLKYILEHGSITPMDAFFDLAITRLPARIHDLRHIWGVDIDTETVVKKTDGDIVRYGRYTLGGTK